jgi:hypothetical protein
VRGREGGEGKRDGSKMIVGWEGERKSMWVCGCKSEYVCV